METKTLKTSVTRTEIAHLVGKNVRVEGRILSQIPTGTGGFKIILNPVKINGISTDHIVLFLNGPIDKSKKGALANFKSKVIKYKKNSQATFGLIKDYTIGGITYQQYQNSVTEEQERANHYPYELAGKDKILKSDGDLCILRYRNRVGTAKEIIQDLGLKITEEAVKMRIEDGILADFLFDKLNFNELKRLEDEACEKPIIENASSDEPTYEELEFYKSYSITIGVTESGETIFTIQNLQKGESIQRKIDSDKASEFRFNPKSGTIQIVDKI